MPVVCNVDNSWTKIGLALAVAPDELGISMRRGEVECIRLNKHVIKEVRKSEALAKRFRQESGDMYEFPFIIHHEGEVPYLNRAIWTGEGHERGELSLLHAARLPVMRLMMENPTPRDCHHITQDASTLIIFGREIRSEHTS